MIKNLFQKNINKGFTLVETLVAITILMISIGGPMVLVGNGINVSRFSRDQVTAFYIAQDAIEALRFVRDANRIARVTDTTDTVQWSYLSSLADLGCIRACDIDSYKVYSGNFDGTGVQENWAGEKLKINLNGYFGHDSTGEDSKFQRQITIKPIENKDEVDILVTVSWDSGGVFGSRQFSVRESLFYWQ